MALNYMHSERIVHRDIKPENIMFSEEDMPKLIDFGLCIQADNRRAEHEIAGTPYYISPDVLSGVYGKECDIWSMGHDSHRRAHAEHDGCPNVATVNGKADALAKQAAANTAVGNQDHMSCEGQGKYWRPTM